jgi:ABC-type proline/glycine betaine transport system permease subunit
MASLICIAIGVSVILGVPLGYLQARNQEMMLEAAGLFARMVTSDGGQ